MKSSLFFSLLRLFFVLLLVFSIITLSSTTTTTTLSLAASDNIKFGSDKQSLFLETSSVIDISDRSPRLTLSISPAADSCPFVVLFYDSMCGHCRDFAPVFTEKIANDLMKSKGILVTAINCAAAEKLCIGTNVTSVPKVFVGNPVLFSTSSLHRHQQQQQEFHVNSKDNNVHNTHNSKHNTLNMIKDASAYVHFSNLEEKEQKVLQEEEKEEEHLKKLQQNDKKNDKKYKKNFKEINSNHGWLDVTSSIPQQEEDSGQTDSLIIKNIKQQVDIILQQFLKKNSPKEKREKLELCKDIARHLIMKKQELIDHNKKEEENNKNNNKKAAAFVPPPAQPCLSDISGALFMAMRHEVVIVPQTKQNQRVLFRFLQIIENAFPGSSGNNKGLGAGEILEFLKKDITCPQQKSEAWGKFLSKVIKNAKYSVFKIQNNDDENNNSSETQNQNENEIISVEWNVCRGSKPNFRGYTCGLWLLFHSVLSNSPKGTAKAALMAIHDYIVNFFICLECRVHFSQFDVRNLFESSSSTSSASESLEFHDNEAILWLYRAHNFVNKRLEHSSGSTDPLVPKYQFPQNSPSSSSDDALLPFSTESFQSASPASLLLSPQQKNLDVKKMIEFLKTHYSWENIEKCGTTVEIESKLLTRNGRRRRGRRNGRRNNNNDKFQPAEEQSRSEEEEEEVKRIRRFNIFLSLVVLISLLLFLFRRKLFPKLFPKAHEL